MNKLLSTFICILIFSVSFGQINKPESRTYLNYYQEIAVAEEAIVNGRYVEGINQYQKTFTEYPYNNPIDCYIAAQAASYVKDTISCKKFIKKGIRFGLPIFSIKTNPHLNEIFMQINNGVIDSLLELYNTSVNRVARSKMITLSKRDQGIIRNLVGRESIYKKDGYTLKTENVPIWDSLLREVMVLTETYGFPAQKIIGTQNGEDSLFRIGPNCLYPLYIFIHRGTGWNEVKDILWKELQKGNITPQMYGTIHDDFTDLNKSGVYYFAVRECYGRSCRILGKRSRMQVDKDRRGIGLCTYDIMVKKFESRNKFLKWRKESLIIPKPFFDFECELSFGNTYKPY